MQLKIFLQRLRKPSVVISIVSQIAILLISFGFDVNHNAVLQFAEIICSLFVFIGIMHNPDAKSKGYGDDILECSNEHEKEPHVLINGRLVCKICSTYYDEENKQQINKYKKGLY